MAKKERERRAKYQKGSAKEKASKRDQGFESGTVRCPEGMSFFKIEKAGVYNLDVMPYIVKKGRDKKGGNPNCDSDLMFYERTYYMHRNVGAEGKSFTCLSRTFGKKCPICEHRDMVKKDKTAKKDAYKAFNPKQRQLFYVSDQADPDKGVQLWDMSYYLFGEKLDDEMEATPDGHPDLDFFDPEEGSTLRVMFKEESFDGNDFFKASSIKFTLRGEALPDEVMELEPLDDLIIETPYDKLKAIFDMEEEADEDEDEPKKVAGKKPAKAKDDEDEDEDEEEPAPKKTDKKAPAKAKPKDDEDEDDEDEDNAAAAAGIKVGSRVETDEHGPCEVVKITDDGDTVSLKDEDGEVHKGVDVDDCELLKAKADKKPAKEEKKPAKTPPKKSKDDDEDEDDDDDDLSLDLDDDDDDDEEDEPEVKKPAPKKKK